MTDPFETELREVLARRAAGVAPDATSGEATIAERLEHGDDALGSELLRRSTRWGSRAPVVVAAAVLAVLGLVAAMLLVARGDDPVETGPSEEGAPVPLDPATLPGFAGGPGTADDVAMAYLESRFGHRPNRPGDNPIVGPMVAHPAVDGGDGMAAVSWSQVRFSGPMGVEKPDPHTGVVHLRAWPAAAGEGWDVVLATTDGVTLDGLERSGERISGTVRSEGRDPVAVVVTDIGENPVAPATAARGTGPAEGRLVGDAPLAFDLDLPPGLDVPVILRIQHVFDSDHPNWRSLTELRLDSTHDGTEYWCEVSHFDFGVAVDGASSPVEAVSDFADRNPQYGISGIDWHETSQSPDAAVLSGTAAGRSVEVTLSVSDSGYRVQSLTSCSR